MQDHAMWQAKYSNNGDSPGPLESRLLHQVARFELSLVQPYTGLGDRLKDVQKFRY